MPEGHSIRNLANRWNLLAGQKLSLSSPQGRFSQEAATLTGSRFLKASAHGKHLFLEFEGDRYIHIHLGLYGRFTWHRSLPAPQPRDTVRLRAFHAKGAVDLSGPTRCELIADAEKQKVHARLGPDPLHEKSSLEPIRTWLESSSWPVGKTVLDQSKIAGIGNVYRAELFFMAALNPWRETKAIDSAAWDRLYELARILLSAGVEHGRIETTAAHLPPPATLPPGTACASRTYVYKRTGQPCLACGTIIQQTELAGRTLYWCPSCQKG